MDAYSEFKLCLFKIPLEADLILSASKTRATHVIHSSVSMEFLKKLGLDCHIYKNICPMNTDLRIPVAEWLQWYDLVRLYLYL